MSRAKPGLHIHVAGHARFGITLWIDDRVARAAAGRMDAPGAVAGLTTHLHGVGTLCFQPGVRRCMKVFINVCVAFRAVLVAHERRALNVRRYDNRPLHIRAGDQRGDRGYPKQAKQHGPLRDRSPRWWIG